MSNSRRKFLKNLTYGGALVLGASYQKLSAAELFTMRNKVKLRFIVASDSHYGQPNTEYDNMLDVFLEQANFFHQKYSSSFCVINGDLIHDEGAFMPRVKHKYDKLEMPYYVTQGNHDRISNEQWEKIWGMPMNYSKTYGENAFIMVSTSNEKGEYLSPDLVFLKEQLEITRKSKNTFLFVHIPQFKRSASGIETPAFFELLKNYPNVKATFHGHEHTQDGIVFRDEKPFIFDSHIGGNWGTDYRGFRVVELMKDNSLVTYMMNPSEAMMREVL